MIFIQEKFIELDFRKFIINVQSEKGYFQGQYQNFHATWKLVIFADSYD